MPLIRLSQHDGTWQQLEEAWAGQCAAFNEDYADFATHTMEHARRIAGENPQPRYYGVFGLDEGRGVEGIMHVNRAALPGTTGHTLRVVWVLLSPRHDYDDVSATDFATVATGIITGAMGLACGSEMSCQHLKIHMGDAVDRTVFAAVAGVLGSTGHGAIAVRGGWFHIDGVGRPVAQASVAPMFQDR